MLEKIKKTEEEWRKILTPEQYSVMRQKGTESAFSCNWKKLGNGTYNCSACGLELFNSESKFESQSGWPSFFVPVKAENVIKRPDHSFGMKRTEVLCARCESHLGHVFTDVSPSKGKRYCINSVALKFDPAKKTH